MNEIIRRIWVHGLASVGVLWCSFMVAFGPLDIQIVNGLFLMAFILVFVCTWKEQKEEKR